MPDRRISQLSNLTKWSRSASHSTSRQVEALTHLPTDPTLSILPTIHRFRYRRHPCAAQRKTLAYRVGSKQERSQNFETAVDCSRCSAETGHSRKSFTAAPIMGSRNTFEAASAGEVMNSLFTKPTLTSLCGSTALHRVPSNLHV